MAADWVKEFAGEKNTFLLVDFPFAVEGDSSVVFGELIKAGDAGVDSLEGVFEVFDVGMVVSGIGVIVGGSPRRTGVSPDQARTSRVHDFMSC